MAVGGRGRGPKVWPKIGPDTAQGNGWDFSYNIFIEEALPFRRIVSGKLKLVVPAKLQHHFVLGARREHGQEQY